MHIHNIFPVLALKWMNFVHCIFVCFLMCAIEKIEIYNKKSCKKFLCNIFYKFQFFQWQSLKNAQNM